MIRVSGAGLVPAGDPLEAQLAVVDELTTGMAGSGIGLPFETQTAQAGERFGGTVGRAVSCMEQVYAERGPHGWKITDRPGVDLARQRAHRDTHLDALEIALVGYSGPLTISTLGPISLAAELYTARADRVVADQGAVTEVSYALAEGLTAHSDAIRARVPGIDEIIVQIDEPLLGAALAGVLPSFSGMFRLRRLDQSLAREGLTRVISAFPNASVVHLGASMVGFDLVRDCGVSGVGIHLGGWDEAKWTRIAQAVEAGTSMWWSMPAPALSQCAGPQVVGLADQLWHPWRRIGLPGEALLTTVMLDGVGERPATMSRVRDRLASLVRVSEILMERADK